MVSLPPCVSAFSKEENEGSEVMSLSQDHTDSKSKKLMGPLFKSQSGLLGFYVHVCFSVWRHSVKHTPWPQHWWEYHACTYWPVCLFSSADAELDRSEAFPVTLPCSLTLNPKITVKMWCSLVSLRNAFQFWIIGKNPAPQIFSGLGLFRASVAAQQCLLKRQVSFLFCSSVLRLLAHYFRVQGDRCYSPQILFLGRRNSHHTSYMYPLFFLWFYRMLSLIFDKLVTNPWSQFNHELTELDHRFFWFSEEVAPIMGKQMWFS